MYYVGSYNLLRLMMHSTSVEMVVHDDSRSLFSVLGVVKYAMRISKKSGQTSFNFFKTRWRRDQELVEGEVEQC